MMLLVILASFLPPVATCQPISADRIYVRDLAAAAPAFATLPQDLEVGFGPAPGQIRIFHPADLRRIAHSYLLQDDFSNDICFAWRMSVPARQAILEAMYVSLDGRSPQIELVEQSLTPAPAGKIVFPLSGLSGVSEEAVTWRGYVKYANDRHFQIWARARVRVRETHVIAAANLQPGNAITLADLRSESYEGPPLRARIASTISRVAGMLPRRLIPAGLVLSEDDLAEPREVERGDTVQVIVETGRARIEAQGIAEEGGGRGAIIHIKNQSSGKKFRARVEEKGKVSVVPGPIPGIAVEESES